MYNYLIQSVNTFHTNLKWFDHHAVRHIGFYLRLLYLLKNIYLIIVKKIQTLSLVQNLKYQYCSICTI